MISAFVGESARHAYAGSVGKQPVNHQGKRYLQDSDVRMKVVPTHAGHAKSDEE